MTWEVGVAGSTMDSEPIPEAQAPMWVLGAACFITLLGFASRLFFGLGGAVVAYGLGLAAFILILLFRRRLGVLSQTAFVASPDGLNAILTSVFLFTAVEVMFAAWPIATEWARG